MSNAAEEDARLKALAAELRCLVCQNQSIADSNASLAVDLRTQVTEQIKAGKTNAEIKQYMAERYGDFVLYKPPFSACNAALWVGPFVLLGVAVVVAWIAVKRRNRAALDPTPDPARAQALETRYQRDTKTP